MKVWPRSRGRGHPFNRNRFYALSCYVPFMQGRDKLNDNCGEPMRLTPGMASLRLMVLRFVRRYLTDWGASPSYGEIAAALDTNRTRVRKAVKSLAGDGLLLRAPGPRGLTLPDTLAEAMRLLTAMGYVIDPLSGSVTKTPLIDEDVLDYVPPGSTDGASGGKTEQGCQRGGAGDRDAQAGRA